MTTGRINQVAILASPAARGAGEGRVAASGPPGWGTGGGMHLKSRGRWGGGGAAPGVGGPRRWPTTAGRGRLRRPAMRRGTSAGPAAAPSAPTEFLQRASALADMEAGAAVGVLLPPQGPGDVASAWPGYVGGLPGPLGGDGRVVPAFVRSGLAFAIGHRPTDSIRAGRGTAPRPGSRGPVGRGAGAARIPRD